jgi:hypothetical protein
LFADLQSTVYKPIGDFQMLVGNRVAQHKLDENQRLDDERARMQAEEQKKADKQFGLKRRQSRPLMKGRRRLQP